MADAARVLYFRRASAYAMVLQQRVFGGIEFSKFQLTVDDAYLDLSNFGASVFNVLKTPRSKDKTLRQCFKRVTSD